MHIYTGSLHYDNIPLSLKYTASEIEEPNKEANPKVLQRCILLLIRRNSPLRHRGLQKISNNSIHINELT